MKPMLGALLLLLLGLHGVCFGGELLLTPQVVKNGGVAVLRWTGEPPDFGVVRLADRIIYLYPDRAGAIALLPVPLDMPPGLYPLPTAVVAADGTTHAFELELQVRHQPRPEESLTLPERMVSPSEPADLERIARDSLLLNDVFARQSERVWDTFARPVAEPVSSVFGKRRLLNGQPRAPHSGTDFRSPAGTSVRALSSAQVVLVEELFYTGRTVVLDHGEGLFSVYAHLSASTVQAGEAVSVGEVIGKVGSTGRSTGPHLHLSVRLLGARVDPMLLLEALQPPGP